MELKQSPSVACAFWPVEAVNRLWSLVFCARATRLIGETVYHTGCCSLSMVNRQGARPSALPWILPETPTTPLSVLCRETSIYPWLLFPPDTAHSVCHSTRILWLCSLITRSEKRQKTKTKINLLLRYCFVCSDQFIKHGAWAPTLTAAGFIMQCWRSCCTINCSLVYCITTWHSWLQYLLMQ